MSKQPAPTVTVDPLDAAFALIEAALAEFPPQLEEIAAAAKKVGDEHRASRAAFVSAEAAAVYDSAHELTPAERARFHSIEATAWREAGEKFDAEHPKPPNALGARIYAARTLPAAREAIASVRSAVMATAKIVTEERAALQEYASKSAEAERRAEEAKAAREIERMKAAVARKNAEQDLLDRAKKMGIT